MSGRIVLAAVIALALPAAAGAQYAPLGYPGPALTVARSLLAASLSCSAGVDHAVKTPVLLVHGTGANVKDNWSWTYEPALDKLGIPWCAVDMPQHANGDIQTNAEYVLYAIRTMHARAGRRISVIGHSQGGMVPRWVLRFWPDTRAMVDDYIGFAPTSHGTTVQGASCPCAAADWQQGARSDFIRALNSGLQTFPGISYTIIYTHTDETVQPNSGPADCSSCLRGGPGAITNVATQDICPADVDEHLMIGTIDPVAYALAIDALEHPGPAGPARISPSVCLQVLQPGIDPITFPTDAAAAALDSKTSASTPVAAEPPLRCYVTASCQPTVRLQLGGGPRSVVHGRRVRLRFTVTVTVDAVTQPVPVATVRIGSRVARTDSLGRATLRVRFAQAGRQPVVATATGFLPASPTITVR
jgi:hypothetical protein